LAALGRKTIAEIESLDFILLVMGYHLLACYVYLVLVIYRPGGLVCIHFDKVELI
jgi:hypothetical protein